MFGKIPDDLGFHCFPTVPDFAEILGNCQTSILGRFSVSDAIFVCCRGGGGELGTVANELRGLIRS